MKIEYKFNWRYNPKSNRLEDYDYSINWAYFITICCKDRQEYFWKVIDWKMILNEMGNIIKEYYIEIKKKYSYIILDEFIVMPNHIHFIIFIRSRDVDLSRLNNINDNKDVTQKDAINGHLYKKNERWWFSSNKNCMLEDWLWKVINWYKWRCSFEINNKNNFDRYFAWQRNYFDRIIRNDDELYKIRKYIKNNPLKWELEKDNEQWILM